MPRDSLRVEEAAAWLQKARNDLRSARLALDADPPLIDDALFHCQQAAEKAEKALLVWHDKPFRKIHDLAELGGLCAQAEPNLEPLCHKAEELTVFATAFRYPGDYDQPPRDEAEGYFRLAREICDAIASRLPNTA